MTARLLKPDGAVIGEIQYGIGQEPVISDIIDLENYSFMVKSRRFRTSSPKDVGYAGSERVVVGLDLTVSQLAHTAR